MADSKLLVQTMNGITTIRIWSGGVTDYALDRLQEIVGECLVNPQEYDRAVLLYRSLPDGDHLANPDNYPLKFYSNGGKKEIWLSGVTAGYRGTGPHGAVKALDMMGFKVNPEDVFNLENGKELVIRK